MLCFIAIVFIVGFLRIEKIRFHAVKVQTAATINIKIAIRIVQHSKYSCYRDILRWHWLYGYKELRRGGGNRLPVKVQI